MVRRAEERRPRELTARHERLRVAGKAMKRRSFIQLSAGALAACAMPRVKDGESTDDRPRPTPAQLAWQRDELAMFLHFGVNTFTDREWGDGRESPAIFNPAELDARQWARAAREAGVPRR